MSEEKSIESKEPDSQPLTWILGAVFSIGLGVVTIYSKCKGGKNIIRGGGKGIER